MLNFAFGDQDLDFLKEKICFYHENTLFNSLTIVALVATQETNGGSSCSFCLTLTRYEHFMYFFDD